MQHLHHESLYPEPKSIE